MHNNDQEITDDLLDDIEEDERSTIIQWLREHS